MAEDAGDQSGAETDGVTAEYQPRSDREFGPQGWLLVGSIFVAFGVIPVTIYLTSTGVLALPFRFTFLVLPLVPAFLLALLAVWVTTTA